jgi:hypothetical protein
MHSVSLGCVSVKWLLETMEEEFYRSSRMGAKAYITQFCLNFCKRFLAVAKYNRDGQRDFVVLQKV